MTTKTEETYKGWAVSVKAEKNMCANFSFNITSPSGDTQHVVMGGDSEERALERAKEMIEMELAFAEDE